ncbi:hypothetical protein DNU06_14810 [Putridiphycobacter roseus]|uniref:Uncharacterized protein n=1 Tax=Putridiphycobacter roseus TaxID=2219161 RepID=A0A2W1NNA6_9FLAO|nr:hypothetical protein [Putridiphycobacter roseus]PZE16068.1 hypothetical protein DNU06_14810 [Putridiphycobacter roseus]
MEPKKEILNQLKKAAKPKLPENFFEQFNEDLMGNIESENKLFSLSDLQKNEKPTVPTAFFETFAESISAEVKPKSKIKHLFAYISLAAAVIIILFSLPLMTNNNSSEQLAETYTAQEEVLLSYVSENDLIDFYTEPSEITNENVLEEVLLDDMDFDVYDYYLEQ